MKQMTQLGKMFTYIALMFVRGKVLVLDEMCDGAQTLVKELERLNVIQLLPLGERFVIGMSENGLKLINRYFAACADELSAGHFGKYTWNKRTKYHQAIMARIA